MPNANQFYTFATGGGAYVLSNAAYLALAQRTSGYPTGLLPKEYLNSAIRQGSFVAAALSQWVADHAPAGNNVNDDGVVANWEANFQAAFTAAGGALVGSTFTVFNGNPNGNVAGVQGNAASVPKVFPTVCWDTANSIWWVCIVTGNAAAAVWTVIGESGNFPHTCTQTGGTANAPILVPPADLIVINDMVSIAWKATTGPNTGAVVLTITGFGNYPLYQQGPGGPTPLVGGEIEVGNIYIARYNAATGRFQLVDSALGTAAQANASSNTGVVAAVLGGVTAGHYPKFGDNQGTIVDGGPPGAAAAPLYLDNTFNGQTFGTGGFLADTTAAAWTGLLPPAPAKGDSVELTDPFGTWGTNNLTVNRNGKTIMGQAANLICNVSGESFRLIYNGAGDWRLE
jgi:hypothetical protein